MKLRKLIGGLTLGVVAISSAIAGLVSIKNSVMSVPVMTEATDFDGYYNVSIQGRRSSGGTWETYSTTQSSSSPQIEYKDFACSSGFEFLGYYDKDYSGHWIKAFSNGATGSSWDNNGTDGNARCQTNGVYSLYFKPADGKTYIAYGTITVTLHYMNEDTGSELKTETVNTTSQNNFAVPGYNVPSGYAKTYNWKTTNSKSATDYSGTTRITTKTWNLYCFCKAANVITYDRNIGTGSAQATQVINPGASATVYTPQSSPLNTSAWNPSNYKRFVHWNTSWDDKGDVVSAGSSVTPTSSYTLYYIEDWYQYRYRVDSGSYIDLVANDNKLPSGTLIQFTPSSGQELPLHGKLSFQYSTNGGSTWNNITTITFEGNYNTTTGIELSTFDTIFLKLSTSGAYSCYVPGISDRTICIFDSSSATTGGAPYSMRGTSNTETVTTEEVYIEKGQYVRRGYAGNYTYGSILIGETNNCFEQVDSETAVKCLITGLYWVKNQAGSMDNWKDIVFVRDDAATANHLAKQFNTTIESICSGITGGTKSLSDLQNVWGSKSGTTLNKNFVGQLTATLNYFKTSSTTTDTDILACVAKYDYIINKYGTTALPDFIGRNNGYQAAPQGRNINLVFNTGTNNSTVVIIIVSTLVAVSAVGGYFLLRKRKEQ